jgi:hypothetical protein
MVPAIPRLINVSHQVSRRVCARRMFSVDRSIDRPQIEWDPPRFILDEIDPLRFFRTHIYHTQQQQEQRTTKRPLHQDHHNPKAVCPHGLKSATPHTNTHTDTHARKQQTAHVCGGGSRSNRLLVGPRNDRGTCVRSTDRPTVPLLSPSSIHSCIPMHPNMQIKQGDLVEMLRAKQVDYGTRKNCLRHTSNRA